MGEDLGEGAVVFPGEGRKFFAAPLPTKVEIEIKEKKLTFEEASKCLNTLGKDESGSRYAYLMITAVDRELTDVSIILNFKHVLFLDLSGNYLTMEALQVLADMPFLILLKAERNRVESACLKPMPYLQVLDLNQNHIKDVENINQPLLDCLEMNYNDIYVTKFDSATLTNLKQLEMRSNLLFEISGVYPKNIEKLYLASNKISVLISTDFANLKNLEILHLRDNLLQKLDGFSENQVSLKYLNLRNNRINRFNEFKKLQCLPNLETLIVTGNPLIGLQPGGQGGEEFPGEGGGGRDPAVIPLLVILPNLKRINKTVVLVEDKIKAEDMANDILEALYMDGLSSAEETDRESTTNTNVTDN